MRLPRGRLPSRRGRQLASHADEGSLRAFSNRRAAHRRREDGTVQLAPRPRLGRRVRAAHRGHRPRALHAGERRADPRRAALARARLGRGADLAGGAARPPHARRSSSCSTRGHAYEDEGAVRLRVPDEGEITFHDVIRGDIAHPYSAIKDFVIQRSDGSPLYNLAVAVDDRDMGITHVVRGEDHLSNTPAAADDPAGARRTSRRCTRTCRCSTAPTARSCRSATARRRSRSSARTGYLPEAVRNYIALLGWGYDETTHLHHHRRAGRALRPRARVEEPGRVRRAEAALDERPLPARAARRGPPRAGSRSSTAASIPTEAVAISQEKMQTLADFWPLAGFLVERPDRLRREGLASDGAVGAPARGARGARAGRAVRRGDGRGRPCARVVDELEVKPKEVFQPVRVAITGTTVSPGIFESVAALGPRRDARPARLSASESRFRAAERQASTFRPRPADSQGDCWKPRRLHQAGRRPGCRRSRRHNEGHGRRLTAAFEALEAFPALAESRNRVLRVVREDRSSVGEVVAAVESDVALVITVLRIANRNAAAQEGQDRQHPRGGRDPLARGRGDARRPRRHLRLLRAHARAGT